MQLPASFRNATSTRCSRRQTGSFLLVVASLLVGVAIASPDPFSRALNGVSGMLWMVGAGFLVASVRQDPRFWPRLAAVVAAGMFLVVVVKPGDLLIAGLGFGIAGAAIAWSTRDQGWTWALILPALWLPEHLLTAVAKASYRAILDRPASLRSEPPPTAALVPFAMVAAAWIGGWLVLQFAQRRSSGR